jgi:hypothetical protein
MGKHTEELQGLLTLKMDGRKKMPRDYAFAHVRGRIARGALYFDQLLENLYKMWEGVPPESEKDKIDLWVRSAAAERERLRDLDELEASNWRR